MSSDSTNADFSDDEFLPGENRYHRRSRSSKKTPKKSTKNSRYTPKTGSMKRKAATPKRKPQSSRNETPKRRFRPGRRALQEIRAMQNSTMLCIRKLPFSRVVREIQFSLNAKITHWQVDAIRALQEATEAYLVRFFEDCNEAAVFARRVTIMKKDLQFISKIRSRTGQL